MSLYQLKQAELNGVEGQGYVYAVKTFRGKQYKGVFFTADPESVQQLMSEDNLEFSGTIYDVTRERNDTLTVDIVNTVTSGIGERCDFVVKA